MIIPIQAAPAAAEPPGLAPDRLAALGASAEALEAGFLAEMLKAAGPEQPGAFGGGAGESQFGSLLVRERAGLMARAGGIGLAESILAGLIRREGA